MISVQYREINYSVEFRQFVALIAGGAVPPYARISGEILTNGQPVVAYRLRTYALLTGRLIPPPNAVMDERPPIDISLSLQRMGWVNRSLPAEPYLASRRLPEPAASWHEPPPRPCLPPRPLDYQEEFAREECGRLLLLGMLALGMLAALTGLVAMASVLSAFMGWGR